MWTGYQSLKLEERVDCVEGEAHSQNCRAQGDARADRSGVETQTEARQIRCQTWS